jgi:hypothetical protein
VQVGFTPAATGVRPGTLSIASSASSVPLVASLTGTGAQSYLKTGAASLNFGSVALGATGSLSLTLANTGTSLISGLAFAATSDFAVTTPCSVTTLIGGASCSVTVAFTPTVAGARTGTLTISSSDPASPLPIALSGTGTVASTGPPSTGTFTLTVDGGSSSTKIVASSNAATYALAVVPQSGFTGTVVLNCTPITAAPAATCSMLPSSIAISGTGQSTATVTINTVSSAANGPPSLRGTDRIADRISLCLLAPAAFLFWRFRKALRQQRISLLVALVCTSIVLLVGGCGSSGVSTLQVSPAGTYQYAVTASSTGTTPVSQTVTLNLIIQ